MKPNPPRLVHFYSLVIIFYVRYSKNIKNTKIFKVWYLWLSSKHKYYIKEIFYSLRNRCEMLNFLSPYFPFLLEYLRDLFLIPSTISSRSNIKEHFLLSTQYKSYLFPLSLITPHHSTSGLKIKKGISKNILEEEGVVGGGINTLVSISPLNFIRSRID